MSILYFYDLIILTMLQLILYILAMVIIFMPLNNPNVTSIWLHYILNDPSIILGGYCHVETCNDPDETSWSVNYFPGWSHKLFTTIFIACIRLGSMI